MAVDKVIVTNVSALRAKYGNDYARVKAAIRTLIQADLARDLRTVLVAIDRAADMKRVKGHPVSARRTNVGPRPEWTRSTNTIGPTTCCYSVRPMWFRTFTWRTR